MLEHIHDRYRPGENHCHPPGKCNSGCSIRSVSAPARRVHCRSYRSLFASEGSRGPRKKPTWSSREKLWYRGKRARRSDSETRTNGLPSIPSATMTGLRTFINGGPQSTTTRSHFEEAPDDWPLAVRKPETTHSRGTSAGEEVRFPSLEVSVGRLLTLSWNR